MEQHLALYRKYRPTCFSEIIGQDHIIKVLQGQVAKGELSHAYLFCGTRGTGKTSTAKVFAKAVNCQQNVNGEACNKCAFCLDSKFSTDVIEIDAASNNRVDEIRELRENIKFAPLNAKYKVYIIDEVHMLTDSAFNALLKTLEEPPAHAIFILATTEPQKLPATILSRCIKFNFRLIPTPVLEEFLKNIFKKENIKADDQSIHLICEAGEGSVRDTLTIADMCASFCEKNITYEKTSQVLSYVSFESVARMFSSIVEGNFESCFAEYNKVFSDGKGPNILCKELLKIFKNAIIIKNSSNANKFLVLPQEVYKKLEQTAKGASSQKLSACVGLLAEFEEKIRFSLTPSLIFEAMLIKMISLFSSEEK